MTPTIQLKIQRNTSDKNISLIRKIRGYAILAKGDTPITLNEEEFLVPSQSSEKKYKVTNLSRWSCECADFQKRHQDCKHFHAIKLWMKLRDKADIDLELGRNRWLSFLKQSLNHPNTTKRR